MMLLRNHIQANMIILTLFSSTAGLPKPGLCKNVRNYFIFLNNILKFLNFSKFELFNKMALFFGAPGQELTEKMDVCKQIYEYLLVFASRAGNLISSFY